MRVLAWSLRHRWVVVLAAVLALARRSRCSASVANENFLPDEDESQFQVTLRAPGGHEPRRDARSSRRASAGEIEKIPGVDYAVTTIGDDPQQTPNLATIYVRLTPPTGAQAVAAGDHRSTCAREHPAAPREPKHLRTVVGPVPALRRRRHQTRRQFQVQGPDLTKLAVYAERLLAKHEGASPAWSTWTRRSSSASRSCACTSTGRRPRTSASAWPTSPTRCGCSSAATR